MVPKIETPDDLTTAVEVLKTERVNVVVVLQTTMLLAQRQRLAKLLADAGLPTVYGYREHVDEGGLVSYGIDLSWCWKRVGSYIDKILKGAAPGDLPIEFPPKIQLVVNLRAAKSLGVTFPGAILARADEVIE